MLGTHVNILGEPAVAPLSFGQVLFYPPGLDYMVTVKLQIQRLEEKSRSSAFKQIQTHYPFLPGSGFSSKVISILVFQVFATLLGTN